MKAHILLFFLSIATLTFAQESPLDGLRVFVETGLQGFATKKGELDLSYTDESPSKDHLTSTTNLNGNPFSGLLRVGAEWETKMGLFLRMSVNGNFGKVRGMSLDFGTGFSYGSKVQVRPNVIFSWGGSKIRLGDIYQNDVYIEVNDTKFYSDRVTVKLANKYFSIRPSIDIAVPVKEFFEMRIGFGYNIPLVKTSPHLRFVGKDIEESPADAKESIFAPNVYIRHNNEIISESIIKYALPSISIGFGWNIGKQMKQL